MSSMHHQHAKCKCINQECRVSLKSAEKQANGTTIIGPTRIAHVYGFQYIMHETSLGENTAFVYTK